AAGRPAITNQIPPQSGSASSAAYCPFGLAAPLPSSTPGGGGDWVAAPSWAWVGAARTRAARPRQNTRFIDPPVPVCVPRSYAARTFCQCRAGSAHVAQGRAVGQAHAGVAPAARAAAQRVDPDAHPVAGLERSALPAFLREVVRAGHLDRPALVAARRADVGLDEGVRVLPLEADDLGFEHDRLVHVEHRVAVMRRGGNRQRGDGRGEGYAKPLHENLRHTLGTFTGVPFLGKPESSTRPFGSFTSRNSPPGLPSRSGFIRSVTRSPERTEVRVHPWRLRLFGLLSSIDQWVTRPLAPGTSISMKAWGLVHWNSVTVPSSVTMRRWSNI